MPRNPLVTTRQRDALLATQICESPILASFDDDIILMNQQGQNIQGPYGILEQREEADTSLSSNPTFDPTTLIDAFQSIALQQRDQQRANQQLYHLVATLSEKVDDLNMKNTEPIENEEGEESARPQSDDGENVTARDKRESTIEEDSTYGDEVGDQRFVDHTFYRHKIGEGFSQR